MATHAQNLHGPKFRRTRTLIAGVAVILGLSLLSSIPAHAAPAADPSTSSDAKSAWQKASHEAEVASEQVNGAKQAAVKAKQAATQAASDLVSATTKVTAAQQAAAAATTKVAGYQTKLDAFANASFRGARLSQFSVMLTAKSAEDFLDESTVINRVAEDTQKTLHDAVAAKNAAVKAKASADAAEASAATAKTQADQAAVTAAAAATTALKKKAQLDAAVSKYKDLYNKLSAKEKAAAAAAAEKARQDSLAAAAAAEAQSQADAVAAAAAAQASDTSASAAAPSAGSSSSTAAATTAAGATAKIQGGDSPGEKAAAAAMTKIGFAYVYAGDGPDAYDCSGLTTWAWAQAGISIPRVSYEQANFPEVPLDQLQPGDLVTYYSPVSHVAIYVGNGMVVSAADEELGIIYVPVERGGPDATGHRVPRG